MDRNVHVRPIIHFKAVISRLCADMIVRPYFVPTYKVSLFLISTQLMTFGGDRHHHQELKPKRSMLSSTIQNTILNETF